MAELVKDATRATPANRCPAPNGDDADDWLGAHCSSSGAVSVQPQTLQQSDASWTPARETHPEARLGWSPAPTRAPLPRYGHIDLVRARADDFSLGTSTCGYVSGFNKAVPVTCVRESAYCTNDGVANMDCCTGDYAACTATMYSACLDLSASQRGECDGRGARTICCWAESPSCYTLVHSTTASPGKVFSIFQCASRGGRDTLLASPPGVTSAGTTSTSSSSSSTHSTTAQTSTPPAPSPPPSSGSESTPVAAIIGGVIGGIAAVGLVALLITFLIIRHRRNPPPAASPPDMATSGAGVHGKPHDQGQTQAVPLLAGWGQHGYPPGPGPTVAGPGGYGNGGGGGGQGVYHQVVNELEVHHPPGTQGHRAELGST
ncbi:hypothetical protein B0T18DRAFT_386841 [Schizothecium vesticola]|uniref:Mid2 domain-containing protein n=1 Tax=Schizothecium vesticola TaxID=314040 RepID=A0AA40KDQ0_9PEZI|nr:hypothetical protein B0T18DRAFT_386841 [Schizothecium vesticola]